MNAWVRILSCVGSVAISPAVCTHGLDAVQYAGAVSTAWPYIPQKPFFDARISWLADGSLPKLGTDEEQVAAMRL
jgi:hypothetical protein